MKNLAGVETADRDLRRELTRCGIEVVEHGARLKHPEMRVSVTGQLGAFTFERAWYYWIVRGPMPLDVAKRLYAHPVGATDIRVAGHCGCPPPEHPWVDHYDADGLELVHDPDGKQEREYSVFTDREGSFAESMREARKRLRFVPDAAAVAVRSIVASYHVDSELGLYLLAEAIRGLPATGRTP